jgi:hypothetical protein
MLHPSMPAPRVRRDGTAQLQLVRRYARLLRETTAETAAARRSGTPARKGGKADR